MATSSRQHLIDWQRRLLPFMTRAIALMAAFFFVASLLVLFSLFREVRIAPHDDIRQSLAGYEQALPRDAPPSQDYLRWKTAVLLEQHVIDQRYRQVNATLLLRAWTRYLGFLTGMILALVGAVFVLARLEMAGTELSAEGGGVKGMLKTSSPGLVMATLGTVLMGITLIVPFQFDTRDKAVYLPGPAAATGGASEECELFGGPGCGPAQALPKPDTMPDSPPAKENRHAPNAS